VVCASEEMKTAAVIVPRLQTRSATPTLHSQEPKYVRNSRLRHNRA
jgi:hypothetical protein